LLEHSDVPTSENRRCQRTKVTWTATVQIGGQAFEGQTTDVSPMGAKVLLTVEIPVGTPANVKIHPPQDAPFMVEAIVWRSDGDGPAFFFLSGGPDAACLARYRTESASVDASARREEPAVSIARHEPSTEAAAYSTWLSLHDAGAPLRGRRTGADRPAAWDLTELSS
jgi:PilZ domain